MFKKVLVCISLIGLTACNDDNKDQQSTAQPEPQLPQVIGHRGASALRPEHTLASYQKAIDDGRQPHRDGAEEHRNRGMPENTSCFVKKQHPARAIEHAEQNEQTDIEQP